MTDASLVDERPVLGGLTAPQVDEVVRAHTMRGETVGVCLHHGPCHLDPDLVEWARREPTGGFVRCDLGYRWAFVPPESCLERVELDAAHVVVESRRAGT